MRTRVEWWWGVWLVVPGLIGLVIVAAISGGFQSPSDVEGDRARSVESAQIEYENADRVYKAKLAQAESTYDEEMRTARKWDSWYFGIPASGWVWLGLPAFVIAGCVLASIVSALQGVVRGVTGTRELRARRAHELEMQKSRTEQARLENDTAVLRRPLPLPSKFKGSKQ